jgi:23S rRNA (cytidine1920-2'-O)/16S rRNA (cytidine1409-2'-O)-methyltransferase
MRLDRLLVARGLAPTRERAQALIAEGVVAVAGAVAHKASSMVEAAAPVTVRRPAAATEYVSRGGHKLAAALDHFGVDPAGAVALDVGASTGGFTDVLLRRGAARVYAIDVGYGQLDWSLRQDARVVVLERENVRHTDPARIPEPCDLAVIDVSFISLTLVLANVAALLGPPRPGGPARKPIIALVKPQFEVGKGEVGKGGVVRDEAARRGALDRVTSWARDAGFTVCEAIDSPIRGPAGNLEFLLLLGAPPPAPS